MSELSVGSLSGLAANSYVVDIASGSSLDLSNATDLPASALPAGSILQVVSTTKTDTFTTTSTSFTGVTGLSVTITPSSTSSKILVMADYMTGSSATGGSTVLSQLVRDGSQIGGNIASNQSNDNIRDTNFIGINYLDSPASTSTLTYQIQIRATSGTGYVGRTGGDSTSMLSHITVMEVAG